VLLEDLVALHVGEALEAHVEDRLRLHLAEAELAHQAVARGGRVGGGADEGDDGVEVVERDLEALEDVQALLRLAQLEDRAPGDDFLAMLDEDQQRVAQREQLRPAADDRQHVDAERVLQLAHLEELVLHDLGNGVALELDDDAHAVAIRLVAQVRDALEALLGHQLGDALDEARLVHLVGQLADDQARAPLVAAVLDLDFGAHGQHAAAGRIGLVDRAAPVDVAGSGEVGPGDVLHELRGGQVRLVDERDEAVDHLGEVVRRDVRRHADGDARRAVDQQVRDARRQHDRLLRGLVVVRREVHRLLVEIRQQLAGDARHADLGVAHGGGGIAVDGAEVALAVDQRVAQGEVLHHADDRVVHGRVAVRMVLADDVADDAGGLLVRPVPVVAEVVHRVERPAMHRLQPVARVRQGARDDDGHGVVHEGLPHLVFDRDRYPFSLALRHVCIPLCAWGLQREGVAGRSGHPAYRRGHATQISRFFTVSAWSSMNLRRGSTSSPMSVENMRSASTPSSTRTCSSVRVSGFIVVSQSCSGFISPRPL
jgi:hypothetical protein